MLIALFLFSQLQIVVPIALSMKGFLSKTFKKSMRVETPKVVSTLGFYYLLSVTLSLMITISNTEISTVRVGSRDKLVH